MKKRDLKFTILTTFLISGGAGAKMDFFIFHFEKLCRLCVYSPERWLHSFHSLSLGKHKIRIWKYNHFFLHVSRAEIYIFPLKRHKSLEYFHSLSFIILSLLLGTANTQHKCDLIFIFLIHSRPFAALHCLSLLFWLCSDCDVLIRVLAALYHRTMCCVFFSVRGGRESYNLYAVIRGLQNIMSNANLRPRNENWYEIKCNDFNKVRWDRCRHFLYIFIATLSLRASHSLHPRNRLVMCCRHSRCVKRRNIVIQDRVKGDDRLL